MTGLQSYSVSGNLFALFKILPTCAKEKTIVHQQKILKSALLHQLRGIISRSRKNAQLEAKTFSKKDQT